MGRFGASVLVLLLAVLAVRGSDDLDDEDQTQEEMASEVGSAHALNALNSLPRFGPGIDSMEATIFVNTTEATDYAISVGSLGVYAALPALLLLLFLPFWILARCCCARCCKCCNGKPRERWSYIQAWSPRICVLLIVITMTVFTALGYVANNQFSESLFAEDDGMYDILKDQVLVPLTDFLYDVDGELEVIYQASKPDGDIVEYVEYLQTFQPEIGNENGDIVDDVNTYCANVNQISFTASSVQYYVEDTYILDQGVCDAMVYEIEEWGEGVWDEFDSTLSMLTSEMLDIREGIFEGVDATKTDLIVPAIDETESLTNDMDDAEDEIMTYEDNRKLAYNILFAFPLVPVFCFLLPGFFLQSSTCFTFAYGCSWIISIFMFFVLALHLPVGGALTDTCRFLDDTEQIGFEAQLAQASADLADMGQLVDACIADSDLVTVFELEEQLNFSVGITWPDVPDMPELFNFSIWNAHTASIYSTPYQDAYSPSISGCDENVVGVVCTDGSSTYTTVINEAEIVDEQINTTMYRAIYIEQEFWAVEEILQPSFDAGENIWDMMRCGFVGDAYWNFKEKFCEDSLSSLALMIACLAVNSCLSVLLMIVVIRCRKQYLKVPADTPQEGERIESAAVPQVELVQGLPPVQVVSPLSNRASLAPNEILI